MSWEEKSAISGSVDEYRTGPVLVGVVVLGAHRPKHQSEFCQQAKVSMKIKIWISIQRLSSWLGWVGLGVWVVGRVDGLQDGPTDKTAVQAV